MTRAQKQLAGAVAVLVFMLLVVVFAQSGGQSGGIAQSGGAASGGAQAGGGVYTAAQAKSGGKFYAQSCEKCHGSALQGGVGTPLTGPAFVKQWERGNLTADDLYYIMSTQMPKDNPGSLKAQQYVDIMAYVLQKNSWPAGNTPLPTDEKVLAKIKLTAH